MTHAESTSAMTLSNVPPGRRSKALRPATTPFTRSPPNEGLASALAARRVYATFRRTVRDAALIVEEDVRRALREAAETLPGRSRASDGERLDKADRVLLDRLHEQVAECVAGASPEALAAIVDETWSEEATVKLRARPALRAHDRAIFRKIAVSRSEVERERLLAALAGRDDELDALTERLSQGEATELVWALVELRIGALAHV